MTPGVAAPTETYALVWIDAREAIIVERADGEITVDRIESDVPDHRKSTGQVRHTPTIRHGGGGSPQAAAETHRDDHLHRYVRLVADRLPVTDHLSIIGPGTVRERLARLILEEDRRHRAPRTVVCEAAERMSLRQLSARLAREAGAAPRRRVVGAYR